MKRPTLLALVGLVALWIGIDVDASKQNVLAVGLGPGPVVAQADDPVDDEAWPRTVRLRVTAIDGEVPPDVVVKLWRSAEDAGVIPVTDQERPHAAGFEGGGVSASAPPSERREHSWVFVRGGEPREPCGVHTVGDDGYVEFDVPSANAVVRAESATMESDVYVDLTMRSYGRELVLWLRAVHRGRVLDGAGGPVPGVVVHFETRRSQGHFGRPHAPVTCDAEGWFETEQKVQVRCIAYARDARGTSTLAQVTPYRETLLWMPGPYRVQGELISSGPEHDPLRGIEVVIQRPTKPYFRATTDAEGRFSIAVGSPGVYPISVLLPYEMVPVQPTFARVTPERTVAHVTLLFEDAETITGTARWQASVPGGEHDGSFDNLRAVFVPHTHRGIPLATRQALDATSVSSIDDGGRFEIQDVARDMRGHLEIRERRPRKTIVLLEAVETGDHVDVVLPGRNGELRTEQIAVRVLDERAQVAVAGATIRLYGLRPVGDEVRRYGSSYQRQTAGDDGLAVFDGVSAGLEYCVGASADGYVGQYLWPTRPGTGFGDQYIELEPRVQLSVVVVDESGLPVEAATVDAVVFTNPGPSPHGHPANGAVSVISVRTDGEGCASLALAPREWRLMAHDSATMSPMQRLPLDHGEPHEITMTLSLPRQTARLEVLVLDALGTPCPLTELELQRAGVDAALETPPRVRWTDGNGRALFDAVPCGAYVLHTGLRTWRSGSRMLLVTVGGVLVGKPRQPPLGAEPAGHEPRPSGGAARRADIVELWTH